MDFDAWTLIINSLLIIAGWFISARWAIKQVNIAHKKNRELQNELLQQAMKDNLYKEFISLYSDIMESINQLFYAINTVGLNMSCDERKPDECVVFGWRDSMSKVNDGYTALGKAVDKLEIWLDASGEFISSSNVVNRLIEDYKHNFTTVNKSASWIALQANSAGILKYNRPDSKRYEAASKPVLDALDSLKLQLKESAKLAQRYLFTREEVNLTEIKKV
jgi:hypothetical protein